VRHSSHRKVTDPGIVCSRFRVCADAGAVRHLRLWSELLIVGHGR